VTSFGAALSVEALKLRRAKIALLTLAAGVVVPLMVAFFMKILLDPSWAARFGVIATKARATGSEPDWAGYVIMLTEAVAVGGFGLFAMLEVWIFGREFSDRTAKDLLALPISRSHIVTAKLVLSTAWSLMLAAVMLGVGLGFGALLDLPTPPGFALTDAVARFAVVAVLTAVLSVPFGLAASVGRGYLPAVGCLFAVVFFANIFAALGLGGWFPWSVPGLLSGATGDATLSVAPASIIATCVVSGAAAFVTVRWWNTADQT